jgi:hypothetical protein
MAPASSQDAAALTSGYHCADTFMSFTCQRPGFLLVHQFQSHLSRMDLEPKDEFRDQ